MASDSNSSVEPQDDAAPHHGVVGDAYVDWGAGEPDRLARLWAPYRMAYIQKSAKDPFVEAPQKSDEDGLIIARGEKVYALLNLFPYNAGHLMVVPYRKVANLEDLTADESVELMKFAQHAVKTLKKVSHPEAINVGFNLGKASGGSVGDHLHMHVVPRWAGDSNFMTVLGEAKVLPQLLSETRRLLAQGWQSVTEEEQGA